MNYLKILASVLLLIVQSSLSQEIVTLYESEQTTLDWDYKDHTIYYFSVLPPDILSLVKNFLDDGQDINAQLFDPKVTR